MASYCDGKHLAYNTTSAIDPVFACLFYQYHDYCVSKTAAYLLRQLIFTAGAVSLLVDCRGYTGIDWSQRMCVCVYEIGLLSFFFALWSDAMVSSMTAMPLTVKPLQ